MPHLPKLHRASRVLSAVTDAPPPAMLHRRVDGTVETEYSREALERALAQEGSVVWVDLDPRDPEQSAVLREVFHFHPLAIEDAQSPLSRVKVDEYRDFLTIVARTVSFCETTPDPYDLDTGNLTIFVTRQAVVTAHVVPLPPVGHVLKSVGENPDVLARGPARIAHMVLDAAVDAYFPIVEQLDEFVDDLEERVFETFDESVMKEIFQVKRLVISLRRYLAPQREMLAVLTMRPSAFVPPEVQIYFRDVYDHMLRVSDALDSYRDLLSSTMDSYLNQVSNRIGSASKGLALVGALSLPFVVVSGLYGMNFTHMPWANYRWGFEAALGAQLVLAGLLVAMLKKKGWL